MKGVTVEVASSRQSVTEADYLIVNITTEQAYSMQCPVVLEDDADYLVLFTWERGRTTGMYVAKNVFVNSFHCIKQVKDH